MRASYFPLVFAFAVASALQTSAQTLPWPNDPAPKQNLPWPDNSAPTGAAGARAAEQPAREDAVSRDPDAELGERPAPSVVEFGKLREEVQKKGWRPRLPRSAK
jgi:hypothetical protein